MLTAKEKWYSNQPISNFSSVRHSPTMRPQQDFSRSFCSCCCPPLLSCSSLVPLGLICNSICVYHVEVSWSYMPGGDHSSPGRVRKPVGPLGPPSPSGGLPTPASCVGQLFGVPGEPVHLA